MTDQKKLPGYGIPAACEQNRHVAKGFNSRCMFCKCDPPTLIANTAKITVRPLLDVIRKNSP